MPSARRHFSSKFNLILREALVKHLIFISFFINLIIVILFNFVFYWINIERYIYINKNYSVFNFFTISFMYLIISIIHTVFQSIEAETQYQKRKYYYYSDEDQFEQILYTPVSLMIAVVVSIFTIFTLLLYAIDLQNLFSNIQETIIEIIFIFFLPAIMFIIPFYLMGNKKLLYHVLVRIEKILFPTKDKIDIEINYCLQNHLDLYVAIIQIIDIKYSENRSYKKNKKMMMQAISKLSKKLPQNFILAPLCCETGAMILISHKSKEEISQYIEDVIRPYFIHQAQFANKPIQLQLEKEICTIDVDQGIDMYLDLLKRVREKYEQEFL
ncbi:MAG: hypothetical protein MJB14_02970 [Spirochaetes bacterium]|nr:hypothetical protein [Spirochaetota bacterium]